MFVKQINENDQESISFANFITGLRCLSRSGNQELDKYIYQIFALCDELDGLGIEEMVMMIRNLPDLGFGNNFNSKYNNKQYRYLRD